MQWLKRKVPGIQGVEATILLNDAIRRFAADTQVLRSSVTQTSNSSGVVLSPLPSDFIVLDRVWINGEEARPLDIAVYGMACYLVSGDRSIKVVTCDPSAEFGYTAIAGASVRVEYVSTGTLFELNPTRVEDADGASCSLPVEFHLAPCLLVAGEFFSESGGQHEQIAARNYMSRYAEMVRQAKIMAAQNRFGRMGGGLTFNQIF